MEDIVVVRAPPPSVASLNRHAVQLLRCGDHGRARATLQRALTTFRQQLEDPSASDDDDGGGGGPFGDDEAKEEKCDDVDGDGGGGGDDDDDSVSFLDSEDDRDPATGSTADCDSAKAFEASLSFGATSNDDDDDDDALENGGGVGVALVSLDEEGGHPQFTSSCVTESNESSVYYFINKAMVFTTRDDDDDEAESKDDDDVTDDVSDAFLLSSSSNSARATAVLCYNIAMTYHLQVVVRSPTHGRPTPPPCHEEQLRRAARLYDLVLDRVVLADLDRRRRPAVRGPGPHQPGVVASPSTIRIGVALWNNKGHVHHCLGEYEHVKACVRSLSRWAYRTTTANDDNNNNSDAPRPMPSRIHSHRVLGDAALPLALNVHLHQESPTRPASSA